MKGTSRGLSARYALCIAAFWCAFGCKGETHEEKVRFASGNIKLAGILVIPQGQGRHPAVVIYHGSGPEERNVFMARWFGAHGVAALTYDKRGVGESEGDFRAIPFQELCADGLAGIRYLKSRQDIDEKHIGVWGLSQGGWLGPLAASKSADISFVIAVSGPGVTPGEQMIFYYAKELEARGLPEQQIREATHLRRTVWAYMSGGQGYEKAKAGLQAARSKPWYAAVKSQHDALFSALPTPAEWSKPDAAGSNWFRREMNYDPVRALQALHVPSLFLFGEEDRLVPVGVSVDIIRRTLTESRARDFTIRVFPHLDHGMHQPGGEIDPEYLATIDHWLTDRVPR